jgi:hypothetical protein
MITKQDIIVENKNGIFLIPEGTEIAAVDQTKVDEYRKAFIDSIGNAKVEQYRESEPSEEQTRDHPGVAGYEFIVNTIKFPINVNIQSAADMAAFKVALFDEEQEFGETDNIYTFIDNPVDYVSRIETLDSDYGDVYNGWTEFGVSREGGKFYFKGDFQSSSDDGNFLNFNNWAKNKSFSITQMPGKPKPDWSKKGEPVPNLQVRGDSGESVGGVQRHEGSHLVDKSIKSLTGDREYKLLKTYKDYVDNKYASKRQASEYDKKKYAEFVAQKKAGKLNVKALESALKALRGY